MRTTARHNNNNIDLQNINFGINMQPLGAAGLRDLSSSLPNPPGRHNQQNNGTFQIEHKPIQQQMSQTMRQNVTPGFR